MKSADSIGAPNVRFNSRCHPVESFECMRFISRIGFVCVVIYSLTFVPFLLGLGYHTVEIKTAHIYKYKI